jgi:hypothetical protein
MPRRRGPPISSKACVAFEGVGQPIDDLFELCSLLADRQPRLRMRRRWVRSATAASPRSTSVVANSQAGTNRPCQTSGPRPTGCSATRWPLHQDERDRLPSRNGLYTDPRS